jgi:signal transduction histidine kinase
MATFLLTLAVVGFAGLGPRHGATEQLLPHGFCYSWEPSLVRLHVVSDVLIGLAYLAIPIALLRFIRRRTDVPFNWMFLLFGVFIVACGATHWMEVWTLWQPSYWLSGAVKAVTAAASVPTAILLYLLLPQALALPSTRQLQAAKDALEREVAERGRIEAALRDAHSALEARVEERTRELTAANAQLTEQRRVLEESDRRKGEFLAILSHELRNPVHAVHAGAQFIGLAAKEPKIVETARIIQRQVDLLTRHLDDLLRLIKGEYEPGQLDLETVDLREVVRRSAEIVQPAIREKNQALRIDEGSQPVDARVDVRRLTQAVANILRNASAYSDAGCAIDVALQLDGRHAQIVVKDQGIGLDPGEASRLFELFSRGERAKRKAASGLGIGLHVAKQIVLAHGGQVDAQSSGVGAGTTFTIRLPLA